MTKLKPCPFCGITPDLCKPALKDGPEYVSHPKGDCILTRSIWRHGDPVARWNERSQ